MYNTDYKALLFYKLLILEKYVEHFLVLKFWWSVAALGEEFIIVAYNLEYRY